MANLISKPANKKLAQMATVVWCALVIVSCNPEKLYDSYQPIPNAKWDYNNVLQFEVAVTDTLQAYDIYLNMRHLSNYPLSNLYLFVTTKAPSGESVRDTVEFILANDKGKWLGNGLGDILDYQRIYKRNVRFGQKGMYTFMLQQAMRYDELPNVTDAGLRIQKSKN